MTEKKKGAAWANMDCENWGGYMAAKKAKLEEQFQDAAKSECKNVTSIFNGIAIFVNGYTDPTADELKRLMMAHGGVYHHYTRTGSTTHIIASNLPYSKIVAHKKAQNPLPICKPEWITDSIKAGKLLEYRNYLLYSQCTKTQPQIISKLTKKEVTPACMSSVASNSTKNSNFISEFYNNSRLHHIATMGATFRDYVNELRDKNKRNFPGLDRLIQLGQMNRAGPSNKVDSDTDEAISNSEDENDISNNVQHRERVIMHIDMDCFFVSVGLRNRPELKGLPIAVAHARGNKQALNHENPDSPEDYGSMSEISSCSYEARKAGVKNGMFLGQALKLCPNLKTIRYDFEGYKEVSYTLYDTVASYTLDIEAVSCDEMYADCSQILKKSGLTPLEFADVIRKEIKAKTGCPVSTGFGSNKLQARLATKNAKPDGQYYLNSRYVESYIGKLNARDLPGVGYATSHKLQEMNVSTCRQLQSISLFSLQQEFGKKTGEQLYNMCRGIDHSKLNLEHVRKSVSAEVNYGIRFENSSEAKEFLEKLCTEVCERLKKANSKGRCISLKLMVRAEEAPKETAKFMGHGLCNNFTKSKNLVTAVDDVTIVTKEVLSLWNHLQQSPEDVRGIGIQMSRLESSKGKSGESNLLKFIKRIKHSDQSDLDLYNGQVAESAESVKQSTDISCDNGNSSSSRSDDQSSSTESRPGSVVVVVADQARIGQQDKPIDQNPRTVSRRLSQSIQTTQDAYFKLTKPNSVKSTKSKVPSLHEIDMNVLIELPEDIRNEILNEYKERSRAPNAEKANVRETNPVQSDELAPRNGRLEDDEIPFSQVDPDFLAALPEDMRNEVKTYCETKMKEKERERARKETAKGTVNNPKIAAGWNMFKCEKGRGKPAKPKPSKLKIVKVSAGRGSSKQTLRSASGGTTIDRRKSIVEHNQTKSDSHRFERLNDPPKTDFSILNRSLRSGNLEVADQDQLLNSLVNCLFELPLQQVKQHIQSWISDNIVVNEVDFLSLTTYLGMLPCKRRIEDLHVLLKCTHRCIVKSRSCVWHETYGKILEHVQSRMRLEYESDLIVPRIECTRCEVSL